MKELRIIFATVFLLVLASLTLSSSAREVESDDDRTSSTSFRIGDDSHDEDHDTTREWSKERLKQLREKNKKKSHHLPPKVQSWTTHTGSIRPKPVTPVKPVTPKPETPTKPVTPTPVVATPVTKSATVNYRTPEGSVPVGFSVSVKGGVIIAASSTTKVGGTSGYYQDSFAPKIASAAVWKKVAWLNLSAVGGASLTTGAFEQFVMNNF